MLELLALLSLVVKDGLPLFCTILLLALLVLGVVSDIGILLMEYGWFYSPVFIDGAYKPTRSNIEWLVNIELDL